MLPTGAFAHTLPEDKAEKTTKEGAEYALTREDSDYNRVTVNCARLFPHQLRCSRRFSSPGGKTCRDRVVTHYKAHDGNRRNYRVYIDEAPESHGCI